ncbi:MAG: hypothetical protein IJ668_09310 [Selenomonadaceae bacterium]|nr:hypothetical protein [Selenomonadaceae bacterium]
MRKFFHSIALLIALLIMPSTSLAQMPDITAGETSFVNGFYILKNNVRVVARGRTMTAQEAKVSVFTQKVWAQGDVTLMQDGIEFHCDSIYVQGTEKTVDVLGNVKFDATDIIKITSGVAKFSWGTKLADFYGGVKLEVLNADQLKFDAAVDRSLDLNQIYDHVQYNVVERKLMLVETKTSEAPKVDMPQLKIEI